MPAYAFFHLRRDSQPAAFEIGLCDGRSEAIARAKRILLCNAEYHAVEVVEGDGKVVLVGRGKD